MTLGDEARLGHMLDAARKAAAYAADLTRESLQSDELRLLAITRLLEIVGEAARNVSAESKAKYPEIPWRAIAGTRDRLIHGYFNIDLDILWNILTADMPELIRLLEKTRSGG